MNLRSRLIALALVAAATSVAQARTPATPAVPLDSCVDLGPDHEAIRFGSQYLLVQDGDAHYRLSFARSCDALQQSARVDIVSDGKTGRLCGKGTRVTARTYACPVAVVDRIDADQYARYLKRSR